MSKRSYPFIDLCVHDAIRKRYASGKALALLSADLENVLWANGAGAKLFGYDDIYDFMDDGLPKKSAAYHQIMGQTSALLSGKAKKREIVVRLSADIHRITTALRIERVSVDGEYLLLISAQPLVRKKSKKQDLAQLIDGFLNTTTHAAILTNTGKVLVESKNFTDLNIKSKKRKKLIAEVADEDDRLVKRPIKTSQGRLPAAIAKLTDELHLLIVVGKRADKVQAPKVNNAVPSEHLFISEAHAAKTPQPAKNNETPIKTNNPAEIVSAPEVSEPADFTFNSAQRATRFTWRIDAKGVFVEVSKEFSQAVGPNAADIIGRRFADVALVFNLDPEHTVADLLNNRDTWSGKTIFWPVQGTDKRVPIDLAGLPTYTRAREFDGFRGFGIIRTSEAEADLEKVGLSLVPNFKKNHDSSIENTNDIDHTRENSDEFESSFERQSKIDNEDSFAGEVPALDIQTNQKRRQSDKIIDLEERRQNGNDGLSSGEHAAFLEIGEKLNDFVDKTNDQLNDAAPDSNGKTDTGEELGFQDLSFEQSDENDDSGNVDEDISTPARADAENVIVPSAFSNEKNSDTPAVIDADFLDELPTAAIVHRGDKLLFANRDFFQISKFNSLNDLTNAGGLGGLFVGTQKDGVISMRREDGSEINVRARLQSINWQDGHALLTAIQECHPKAPVNGEQPVLVQDDQSIDPNIFEQKKNQRRQELDTLRTEVGELRSILETATDGVILIDQDGKIRSMNHSASALFNYDIEQTQNEAFSMLFAHESQKTAMNYIAGLSEHGVASVLNDGREVIGRESGGGFLPLFITIGKLSGSSGFCAVLRDITHWKHTEEDLRSAKREAEEASAHKSDFLARVSHEIRTPLNAIIGFSEMMAEERFGSIGNPRYLEYANDISHSGKHVLDIVNDLLDLSKIEAGEQELSFEAVSLNNALAETVSLLQPLANSQRVIIRTSLSPAVPNVVADTRSVKQIALNILSNSLRFTKSGGQVIVSTSFEKNGQVVLRIRDTGIGMSYAQLEQAMKPFKQVNRDQGLSNTGTGLGLPLTKAMVEANRAIFNVTSQPQEGTLVEVVFPPQRVLTD